MVASVRARCLHAYGFAFKNAIVQHLRTVYCRRNDAQFDADMRCVRRRVERSFRLLAIYDACGRACRACHRDFVPLYRGCVEGEIEYRFQRLRVS